MNEFGIIVHLSMIILISINLILLIGTGIVSGISLNMMIIDILSIHESKCEISSIEITSYVHYDRILTCAQCDISRYNSCTIEPSNVTCFSGLNDCDWPCCPGCCSDDYDAILNIRDVNINVHAGNRRLDVISVNCTLLKFKSGNLSSAYDCERSIECFKYFISSFITGQNYSCWIDDRFPGKFVLSKPINSGMIIFIIFIIAFGLFMTCCVSIMCVWINIRSVIAMFYWDLDESSYKFIGICRIIKLLRSNRIDRYDLPTEIAMNYEIMKEVITLHPEEVYYYGSHGIAVYDLIRINPKVIRKLNPSIPFYHNFVDFTLKIDSNEYHYLPDDVKTKHSRVHSWHKRFIRNLSDVIILFHENQ